MGYRLLHELLRQCPAKPGPEFLLLLHLADDASDKTCQTACGYEYMAERTKASRPTIFRWLQKLAAAGHLKVTEHSRSPGRGGGEGRRAVYLIQIPPQAPAPRNEVSGVIPDSAVMRSHKKRPDSASNEVSSVRPEYPAELGFSGNEVSEVRPPTTDASHRTGTGEGARPRPDQDRSGEEQNEDQKHMLPERGARRAPAA